MEVGNDSYPTSVHRTHYLLRAAPVFSYAGLSPSRASFSKLFYYLLSSLLSFIPHDIMGRFTPLAEAIGFEPMDPLFRRVATFPR